MSDCCKNDGKGLIYVCAGGSNVGQLTVEAGKALDSAGDAVMGCLAGLGGHVPGMVASAASGVPVLVIDGCSIACGKKIVDHLGLQGYGYVDVTALGIKKEHNVNKTPAHQIDETVSACRKELARISKKSSNIPGSGCCS
ncbi:MAG: zinc-binding protein [Candidatus Riflebacteria bacterium]|nr:zinc-binding protein [Candidatus Riflebacteria bacterium]